MGSSPAAAADGGRDSLLTSRLHSLEADVKPEHSYVTVRKMERQEGRTHTHTRTHGHAHRPGRRRPPRPLAGLISGDWREHEWKSLWEVQPLEDWVGEVSERT